jgi:N-acetylglucosamine repressor
MSNSPDFKFSNANLGEKRGQNLRSLRSNNLALLLSVIWENQTISRTDLAKITGLSPSSVTRLIRELEEFGLVTETGKGESSGGRQPVLISPNPDAGLVISMDLSGKQMSGGIFDASNKLLSVVEKPFIDLGADAIQNQLVNLISELLQEPVCGTRKLLGIGVSTPGVIKDDEIVVAYNLRVNNFPLKKILETEFDVPVYLSTDTSVAALAEKNYGAGRGKSNLIYLLISTGIGTGIIIDDQIYNGTVGLTGRRGHIVVDRLGPICVCGKRGCLESVASRPAIIDNAKKILLNGRDPVIQKMIGDNPENLDLPLITQAAKQGSIKAKSLIKKTAEHIAYALSLFTTIFGIPFVIIGGEVSRDFGEIFFSYIQEELEYLLLDDSQQIEVVPAKLERDDFLKGISMLTIQQLLNVQF